jgi:hypothetical protein
MPMSMRAIPDRYPNVEIAKRCRPSTSTRTVFRRVLDNDNADESSPDGRDISLAVRGNGSAVVCEMADGGSVGASRGRRRAAPGEALTPPGPL